MPQDKDKIIGQDNLLKFFDKLANNGGLLALGGSFIFLGPAGAGKKTLANILIGKLLCQAKPAARPCGQCASCRQLAAGVNGDVFWLSLAAEQKNIGIEEIRGLLRALSLSALGQGYRAAVIDRAEKLSHQAANALLKTLEEPNKNTVIILLTQTLVDLPATVLSRGQIFAIKPVNPGKIYDWLVAEGKTRAQAKTLAGLSLGWPGLAIKMSDDDNFNNHWSAAELFFTLLGQNQAARQASLEKLPAALSGSEVISVWQTACRDLLLWKLSAGDWLRYGALVKQWADKLNTSVKQITAWYRLLIQADDYLAANVNERAIFDQLIVNL